MKNRRQINVQIPPDVLHSLEDEAERFDRTIHAVAIERIIAEDTTKRCPTCQGSGRVPTKQSRTPQDLPRPPHHGMRSLRIPGDVLDRIAAEADSEELALAEVIVYRLQLGHHHRQCDVCLGTGKVGR